MDILVSLGKPGPVPSPNRQRCLWEMCGREVCLICRRESGIRGWAEAREQEGWLELQAKEGGTKLEPPVENGIEKV